MARDPSWDRMLPPDKKELRKRFIRRYGFGPSSEAELDEFISTGKSKAADASEARTPKVSRIDTVGTGQTPGVLDVGGSSRAKNKSSMPRKPTKTQIKNRQARADRDRQMDGAPKSFTNMSMKPNNVLGDIAANRDIDQRARDAATQELGKRVDRGDDNALGYLSAAEDSKSEAELTGNPGGSVLGADESPQEYLARRKREKSEGKYLGPEGAVPVDPAHVANAGTSGVGQHGPSKSQAHRELARRAKTALSQGLEAGIQDDKVLKTLAKFDDTVAKAEKENASYSNDELYNVGDDLAMSELKKRAKSGDADAGNALRTLEAERQNDLDKITPIDTPDSLKPKSHKHDQAAQRERDIESSVKISRALNRHVAEMPTNTPAELQAKNKLYKKKRTWDRRGGKAPGPNRMHAPGTNAGIKEFWRHQPRNPRTGRWIDS